MRAAASPPFRRATLCGAIRESFVRAAAIAALGVCSGGSLAAETAAEKAETAHEPLKLQTVEVIGRSEEKLFADYTFSTNKTQTSIMDVPQSVSVVTKEVIQDQGLMRLNDIAPYVAGVNEFSTYNDLTIRGFRNSDDRRINGLRIYNNFWSQDLIPHVERIEVIKGPAAATMGAASPGGTINIVTKKPLAEQRNEVRTIIGSDHERYVSFDTTGPLNESETLLYRLNLGYEDSESFRDNVVNKNSIVAPSLSWIPQDGTLINLDIVYTNASGVLDRGQPNVRNATSLDLVDIETSLTQEGDRLDTDNLSVALSLEQALTDNWSLGLTHMYFDYDEVLVEHRTQGFVTGSDQLMNMMYIERDSKAEVHSSTAYLNGYFETGPLFHNVVTGVDRVNREDGSVDNSVRSIGVFDVLNPVNTERNVASYGPLSQSTWGGELTSMGYFINDQITWGDWDLLLGLRYETYDNTSSDDNVERSDNVLLPRVGLTYRLTPTDSIYASYITGFEPPESWVNSEVYGGPFDPQESELFEIGYKKLLLDNRALFTAAVYELTKTNAVVWANDSANQDLYVQRGEERARGLELELHGKVTDRLSVIANYAYNDAEITEDTDPANVGKDKENAPRHAATLWGRYDLTQNWGVGAGATYVGERATFVDSLTLPSYTTYNASLYYTYQDFEAALNVKNLTDETHWTGGYNYTRVFPGDPRSVSLNMSYRF